MSTSESQIKANKKYHAKFERIYIRVSKEEKEREIFDLLETEIDIELEKVSYDIMETVTIPMSDENMIMFMLEM